LLAQANKALNELTLVRYEVGQFFFFSVYFSTSFNKWHAMHTEAMTFLFAGFRKIGIYLKGEFVNGI